VSTLREDFEAWALQERYAERNAHGLWFANNVHEFSLWKGCYLDAASMHEGGGS
jgi:hypothetical protein